METRSFDGIEFQRIDTAEEFATWVRDNGWTDEAAFRAATTYSFWTVRRRWIRITTDRYGKRHIHRRNYNPVRV